MSSLKLNLLKRKEYCLQNNLCFVSLDSLDETSKAVNHSDVGNVSVNSKYIK